jgi:hypothetical protein
MEMASTADTDLNATWINWGVTDSSDTFTIGQLFTGRLFHPTNPYEVAWAIIQAEHHDKTIRALGSGWSFSEAPLPQVTPVTFQEVTTGELQLAGGLQPNALLNSFGFVNRHHWP